MNFRENNQTNNSLSQENSALSWESETTSYGLETADTTSSNEQGLQLIFDENLERELVDSSQFNQDNHERKSLVFIDSAVQDSSTLIDNISGATEIIVLDEGKDELVQISEHLSRYQQLDAVHIVSHGESGQLSFANSELNSDTLQQYDSLLENWRSSLDIEADLVLYGCDIALGEKGNSFLRELSQVSSANILASVDKTGSRGDWELETAIGEIEASSIFNSAIETAYSYTLDEGDITITPGTLPDFGNVDFSDTNFDFSRIDVSDLVLFADANLDFSNVNPDAISNIDFNSIPAEDLEILADAGLTLEPLDSDAISALNLSVLANLGNLDEASYTTTNLSPDTTFSELSDSVVANANLFSYKNSSLSLDDGLSLDEAEQLTQSDFQALDYAFTGDETFDSSFYLAQNSDIAEAGVNPFTHYVESGASEGRDPNLFFDSSFYLEQNTDVRDAGFNPLEHYFLSGASEGRDPNLFFDSSFYLEQNTDVRDAGFNPLEHFIQSGLDEGRASIPALGKPDQILIAQTVLDPVDLGIKIVGGIIVGGVFLFDSARDVWEFVSEEATSFTFTPENGNISTGTPPFELPPGAEDAGIQVEVFPGGKLDNILEGDTFVFPDQSEIEFSGNVTSPQDTGDLEALLEGPFVFPDTENPQGSYFIAIERYDPSQGFKTINIDDPGADRLAETIGGQTNQAFVSDPNEREFDVISDQYIGQAKTGNEQLGQDIRNQAKATFEAAQQSGREVYYQFENQPRQDVVDKLNEYSRRYGVNLTIDVINP